MNIKSRATVRKELAEQGVSINAWARANGFSSYTVQAILGDNDINPRIKCLRGEAHNVAVALGLKHGVICRDPHRTIVQHANA